MRSNGNTLVFDNPHSLPVSHKDKGSKHEGIVIFFEQGELSVSDCIGYLKSNLKQDRSGCDRA